MRRTRVYKEFGKGKPRDEMEIGLPKHLNGTQYITITGYWDKRRTLSFTPTKHQLKLLKNWLNKHEDLK